MLQLIVLNLIILLPSTQDHTKHSGCKKHGLGKEEYQSVHETYIRMQPRLITLVFNDVYTYSYKFMTSYIILIQLCCYQLCLLLIE